MSETAGAIVERLRKTGVVLTSSAELLDFHAPRGRLKQNDLDLLSAEKRDILLYLDASASAALPAFQKTQEQMAPSLTQRMWWRWIDKSASLVLSIVMPICGVTKTDIASAVMTIIDRHEVLRSFFVDEGNALRVNLNASQSFRIEEETLLEDAAEESAVRRQIAEFVGRPLQMNDAWLTRAKIISLSPDRHILAIVFNHLIVDGPSVRILRRELAAIIGKEAADSARSQRLFTYADFSTWQAAWHAGSRKSSIEYWKRWFLRKPALCSPIRARQLGWAPGLKTRHPFTINADVHHAVRARARSENVSVFLMYLGLYTVAISRWSGSGKIAIRSLADGRVMPEMASIVGLMTASDAVLATIDVTKDFGENLHGLEREYYASVRLHSPIIYAFPPHADIEELTRYDPIENIPVVLNYLSWDSGQAPASSAQKAWPPVIHASEPALWPHHVSAICLEVTDHGTHATCAFLLHDDFLSAEEKRALMSQFFSVVSQEAVCPAQGGSHDSRQNRT